MFHLVFIQYPGPQSTAKYSSISFDEQSNEKDSLEDEAFAMEMLKSFVVCFVLF